ncbi:hypothetical protein HPB52_011933 [Rhipicephalus sanguineus]|uniref:Uncharacterized protein n=1 Tax=Rhipicephalus sanguineus TaxID=34632 RepID=A0A9D4T9T0_RHISA|nr:hypothetical protein HPB52_011933 [Rhipicephalus sanguineus]
MDLDASTLSLMLQLFESDPQQGEGGLTTTPSSSSELIERHREKVQQLCEQMQQKGHAKHLNLNRVNSLGLLINLVEHCEENRERLANTQTVGSFESVCDQMEMPAFNALMDLFTDKVEAAHQSEEQANELLSNQEKKMKASLEPQKGEPLPTSQQSALSQADDLEETLMKGSCSLRRAAEKDARRIKKSTKVHETAPKKHKTDLKSKENVSSKAKDYIPGGF